MFLDAPSSRHIHLGLIGLLVMLGTGCTTIAHRGSTEASATETSEMVGGPDRARDDAKKGANDEQATPHASRLWYRIDLSRRAIRVRLRLLDPPETAHFFLPSASKSETKLGAHCEIRRARTPEGHTTHHVHPRRGRIDVASGRHAWVELVYRIALPSSSDSSPRSRPRWSRDTLLAYASTFLIVPSRSVAQPLRDIPVEVHAPASWQLLSTWRRRRVEPSRRDPHRQVYGFVPAHFQRLRNAFLAGGERLRFHRTQHREHRLEIAFAPSYRADLDATATLIERIVDHYRERFGLVGPIAVFVRARRPKERGHRRGTSRRGGFVVALPPRRPPESRDALLIAHEAFHLWNGHALVPSPERAESVRWFLEGVTQYVALKVVRHLGLIDWQETLETLAQTADSYRYHLRHRADEGTRSPPRRWPYDRGLLLALAFDAVLTRESDGRTDITTWFQDMLGDRERSRRYTLEDLEQSLFRLSNPSGRVPMLWKRHVEEGEPLEVRALFRSVGLRFVSRTSTPTLKLRRGIQASWIRRSLLRGPEQSRSRAPSRQPSSLSSSTPPSSP